MNGQQQLAAALGGGLVAANFWTTQRHTFTSGALNSGATDAQVSAAHTTVRNVALEVLFVAAAVLIAGVNTQAAGAVLTVMVALWILWLINRNGNKGGQ